MFFPKKKIGLQTIENMDIEQNLNTICIYIKYCAKNKNKSSDEFTSVTPEESIFERKEIIH